MSKYYVGTYHRLTHFVETYEVPDIRHAWLGRHNYDIYRKEGEEAILDKVIGTGRYCIRLVSKEPISEEKMLLVVLQYEIERQNEFIDRIEQTRKSIKALTTALSDRVK